MCGVREPSSFRRKLDDPLYKYVLREFRRLHIVEKRFNPEAGRLRAPARGPERCCRPSSDCWPTVADAYPRGPAGDDILLQGPVSISFDQLHETAEYAAYARGGEKTPERRVVAVQLHQRPRANATTAKILRSAFPEAVSMRKYPR